MAQTTVYQYTLDQLLFIAGTTAQFNLTITNTATSEEASAVRCKRGLHARHGHHHQQTAAAAGAQISVYLPQGDTNTPGVLVPKGDASQLSPTVVTPPTPDDWAAALVPGQQGYLIKLGGSALGPGQSAIIQVTNISIALAVGSPQISITETINGNKEVGTVGVSVVKAGLAIQTQAVPSTVGLTEETMLYWSATGGSEVIIGPPPTPNIVIPLSGPGPVYSGKTPVLPNQTVPQTVFQSAIWTQDNQSSRAPGGLVSVELSSPVIQSFGFSPAGPFNLLDTVTLHWDVDYATSVYLRPAPGGTGQVQSSGSKSLQPQSLYPPGSVGTSLQFTLSTNGYAPAPQQRRTIQLNPAQILYFGYDDLQSKNVVVQTINGYYVQQTLGSGLNLLTLTGPGGVLTQYLGPGPYLEIQYLGAAPSLSPAPGTSVTLTWQTLNATSLVLNPGNIPLTPVAGGTYLVTPAVTTTYSFTAVNGGGQITSQITVTVQGT